MQRRGLAYRQPTLSRPWVIDSPGVRFYDTRQGIKIAFRCIHLSLIDYSKLFHRQVLGILVRIPVMILSCDSLHLCVILDKTSVPKSC